MWRVDADLGWRACWQVTGPLSRCGRKVDSCTECFRGTFTTFANQHYQPVCETWRCSEDASLGEDSVDDTRNSSWSKSVDHGVKGVGGVDALAQQVICTQRLKITQTANREEDAGRK